MTVHNHGTEDGPGLACREISINGRLVGACIPCADCGHPQHHHHQRVCRTVTVWGPASPPEASAHIEHPGRNTRPCNCADYQPAQ